MQANSAGNGGRRLAKYQMLNLECRKGRLPELSEMYDF